MRFTLLVLFRSGLSSADHFQKASYYCLFFYFLVSFFLWCPFSAFVGCIISAFFFQFICFLLPFIHSFIHSFNRFLSTPLSSPITMYSKLVAPSALLSPLFISISINSVISLFVHLHPLGSSPIICTFNFLAHLPSPAPPSTSPHISQHPQLYILDSSPSISTSISSIHLPSSAPTSPSSLISLFIVCCID